jgi:hypothetical protein
MLVILRFLQLLMFIIIIIITILSAYVYPLGELETSLPSRLTTISRSARQPDVCLLLMLLQGN